MEVDKDLSYVSKKYLTLWGIHSLVPSRHRLMSTSTKMEMVNLSLLHAHLLMFITLLNDEYLMDCSDGGALELQ